MASRAIGRRVALALASLLVCACGGAVVATTSLRMSGTARDASVTIDDQYVGVFAYVAAHGVALPRGKHRVTIEKTGYFTWDRIVESPGGGAAIPLDVVLTKIPD